MNPLNKPSCYKCSRQGDPISISSCLISFFVMLSSNTHFFENFGLDDHSSESIMADYAFMESPSNDSNQLYTSFSNVVQFTSQEALPNFVLREAIQSYDTFNPYHDSTSGSYLEDHVGLYATSPFKSNAPINVGKSQKSTQMPPSMLENHKKAKGQKKNVESKNKINMDLQEKAHIKCRWSEGEDSLLVQLVEQYGDKNWARIAEKLPLRIGKQCRERWHNCLKPNIMNNAWSEEDDKLLVSLHKQFGNKWADIARNMPGRSENSIKNHWNATKRKQFKFSSKGHNSYILKDYITSISSYSYRNQINIQGSLDLDPQNHEPLMSLNGRSSSYTGSGLGYKLDEMEVNDFEFDFDEVSSHLFDQLQFDPQNDMDPTGSVFGIGY